jgi:hypothetical protein
MAKLDIRFKESGIDSLKIEQGGRGRLVYLIIFIFLSLTVFFSLDPSADFTSSRIGGTLFTFLLMIVSLAVTLTVRYIEIDKHSGILCKRVGLPSGIYNFVSRDYNLGKKPLFIIRSTANHSSEPSFSRFSGFNGKELLHKGRTKVTLCLETEEDTITLIEGNSIEQIENAADYLSAYFGFSLQNNF